MCCGNSGILPVDVSGYPELTNDLCRVVCMGILGGFGVQTLYSLGCLAGLGDYEDVFFPSAVSMAQHRYYILVSLLASGDFPELP